MTFLPVAGRRIVEDADLGVRVKVGSAGPDIEALRVKAEGFSAKPLEFTIRRSQKSDLDSTEVEPNLEIQVGGIETMFRVAGLRNPEENTKIVNLIIDGITEFNRHWPQAQPPILYSDYNDAVKKGLELSFSIPSNEELIARSC